MTLRTSRARHTFAVRCRTFRLAQLYDDTAALPAQGLHPSRMRDPSLGVARRACGGSDTADVQPHEHSVGLPHSRVCVAHAPIQKSVAYFRCPLTHGSAQPPLPQSSMLPFLEIYVSARSPKPCTPNP